MNPSVQAPLDLRAYLDRIGYRGETAGEPAATAEVLRALHLAHATRIPFENLDILLGRPIRIDLGSIQAKLVQARRGGYCFEQNTLFAAVLEQLGFRVTRLAARVRLGASRLLPRTHMLLLVHMSEGEFLADVGFGTEGLLEPLPFVPGREERQFSWVYRVVEEGPLRVLQSRRREEGWLDLYAFSLEPHEPIDFEVANWYVSTHPESRFVQTLTAQTSTTQVRYLLRNNDFITSDGAGEQVRQVEGEELLRVLAESFGLHFPPGTRFRFGG
jgi:N-hydroxyarylamine O-acetyltransferase